MNGKCSKCGGVTISGISGAQPWCINHSCDNYLRSKDVPAMEILENADKDYKEVAKRFPLTNPTRETVEFLTNETKKLALAFCLMASDNRERDASLEYLETSLMWAIKASK